MALVEIVPGGMVHGMMAPPIGERRQGREATEPPRNFIGALRAEKGRMAAIMLDHEEAHDQTRRRQR